MRSNKDLQHITLPLYEPPNRSIAPAFQLCSLLSALCTPRTSTRVPSRSDNNCPSALQPQPQPRPSENHPITTYTMSRPSRTATPSRDTGSHTLQETTPNPVLRLSAPSGVLRLRAEPEERRHIQWAEDVIDNEGMGKKSSKGMYVHLPAIVS